MTLVDVEGTVNDDEACAEIADNLRHLHDEYYIHPGLSHSSEVMQAGEVVVVDYGRLGCGSLGMGSMGRHGRSGSEVQGEEGSTKVQDASKYGVDST